MDHSLSLDPNSNEIVKQIVLVLPYLSRKFQKSILPKFGLVTFSILANMQNTSIWHIPFPFPKMHFKMFPNSKTMVMVGFYFSPAVQPYEFHKFLKCIIAPNIWNKNCSIIGITLPLNKNAFATCIKYKTNTVLSLQIS